MEAEKQRNGFGTSTRFSYNSGEPTQYPSSLLGFFPPLYSCRCIMEPFDLPTLNGLHLVPGFCDGVLTGAEALAGFPSPLFLIPPSSDSMASMYTDPRVETNRWWCISRTLRRIPTLPIDGFLSLVVFIAYVYTLRNLGLTQRSIFLHVFV